MDLTFANPAGWWLLLGIPAIIAIHFLQSRTRPVEITTLFLIEPLLEENRRGAVWTRIRQSSQMWLQLLAVALLAWLCLKPVWLRPESVQSVAMVMDQSYSMQAFRGEAMTRTGQLMRQLDQAAGKTEWYVLSSDVNVPTIYRGDRTDEAAASLIRWLPDRAGHDPGKAILRARDLVGPEGMVILVTDQTNTPVPPHTHLLSVGKPVANSGFTGIRFERDDSGQLEWIASVMHYGFNSTSRPFQVVFDDATPSAPQNITLSAGRVMNLRGPVPENARRGTLIFNADEYPVDDVMPFVIPRKKTLTYALTDFRHIDQWLERVMSTVEAAIPAEPTAAPALNWGTFTGRTVERKGHGLFMYSGDQEAGYAAITVVDHPLTRDLNWSGFLGRVAPGFERKPGDLVLVWMGNHPLVILRENETDRQLILCFDATRSNADRLPAVILCLHRFIETVRETIDGYEAVNMETHQLLPIRHAVTLREELAGGITTRMLDGRSPARAPAWPGFITATRNDTEIFHAAVHVVDTAEADLTSAGSIAPDDAIVLQQRIVNSRRDMLTPLWFALLGCAMLASWISVKGGRS